MWMSLTAQRQPCAAVQWAAKQSWAADGTRKAALSRMAHVYRPLNRLTANGPPAARQAAILNELEEGCVITDFVPNRFANRCAPLHRQQATRTAATHTEAAPQAVRMCSLGSA